MSLTDLSMDELNRLRKSTVLDMKYSLSDSYDKMKEEQQAAYEKMKENQKRIKSEFGKKFEMIDNAMNQKRKPIIAKKVKQIKAAIK